MTKRSKTAATAVARAPKVTAPTKFGTSDVMPEYMKNSAPSKLNSNFDQSDLVRPSIKLLQATSPQLKEFKEAKPGVFWHTGANVSLGEEVVFVIAAAKKKYILYAPRGANQPILARAEDGVNWDKPNQKFEVQLKKGPKVVYDTKGSVAASGLAEFGSSIPTDENSPPAATLHYEFLVYLPEFPEFGPTILSLARSQIAPGKRLVTNFQTRARMGDIYGCAFRMAVVESANTDGEEFYNFNFANNGFVAKEFRDIVASGAETFKDYRAADEEYAEAQSTGREDPGKISKF
jgi:hypothetical protein